MFNLLFRILLFVVIYTTLLGCSKDDNELEKNDSDKKKITLAAIEGVWCSGDYFISFGSDKFLTSFVDKGFIDSGVFTISSTDINAEVSCVNSYFNHTTKYTIESIKDDKMVVSVLYINYQGFKKTTTLTLLKTTEQPVVKDNPLIGKSSTSRSQRFGTVTTAFTTYCSGQETASSGSAKPYPLDLFYIYRNNTIYRMTFTNKNHQIPSIGGWTTNANNGKIMRDQIYFAPNGSISSMETIDKF